MDKITFLITIFFCCTLLSAQETTKDVPSFKQGETFFYTKFKNGNPLAFKQADSVFTALKARGDFASDAQRIATELYLIRMGHSRSVEDDLKIIAKLLKDYKTQDVADQDLYDMLEYYREHLRFYIGKSDAEQNILEIIKEQLRREKPNYEVVAMAYDNLSRMTHKKDDYQSAKKAAAYGEKAIIYYDKTDFRAMYVASIQFVGGCYHWMDQAELSLQYMERAYGILKTFENPNPLRLSQLAFNIALINAGQFANKQKSIDYFKESIHYQIEAKGETEFLVMLYSLLSDVYFELKDIEQSEYYAEKGYLLANDILKTENVYYRSLPSMSFSRIYAAKGDFENARRVIDRVVKESIEAYGEDYKFTVQAFNDKANVEIQAENYQTAQAYLLRAVAAAENTDRIYSKISAYLNLVNFYLQSEEYAKAIDAAKIYYELNKLALEDNYMSTASAQLLKAESYIGLQSLDSAQYAISDAKSILKSKNSDTDIVINLRALSLQTLLFLNRYKAENSVTDLNRAYEGIDALIQEIITGKASFKYNESKVYYSESIVETINTAMEVCSLKYFLTKDPKVVNTMFKLMELNKSSVLLDGINDESIKKQLGVPQQLIDQQNSLETKLGEINKQIYTLDKQGGEVKEKQIELANKRLAHNKSLDSLALVLKQSYPKYVEALELKQTEDLSFYQQHTIAQNQALVEYYINDTTIYRLTVTKDSFAFDQITAKENWQQSVSELRDLLIRQNDIDELSSELGALLLPELPSQVTDIIFVLDRSLNQIPFEVLQYKELPLIVNYNINYIGSLQLYEKQKQVGQRQDYNWIGFAPKYEKTSLFGNENEVYTISEIVEGNPVLGEEATKQELINLSHHASIIHLAAHTELDKLNPMLNKILFSKNNHSSELTTSEIYGLELEADMAVLSACNTGTGVYRGDGVMSMSRAFTYAGTSSTVMSLWKVPDEQTSKLMVLFYKYLKQGQSKSEALKNAKLGYIDEVFFEELTHPFYWAGFVLSGDDSPIHFSTPFWKQPTFIIGLPVLLIILVVVAYNRKKKKGIKGKDN